MGSSRMTPLPLAKTWVLEVPRSIARSRATHVIVGRRGSPTGGQADSPPWPDSVRRALPFDPVVGNLRFVNGDPPDDLGAPAGGAEDDGPFRGWVPRDDRLWLHPSERGWRPRPAGATSPTVRPPGGRWLIGGLVACVAVTMVVVGMALVTDRRVAGRLRHRPSTWAHGVPTTEVDLSSLTTARHITAWSARPAPPPSPSWWTAAEGPSSRPGWSPRPAGSWWPSNRSCTGPARSP